MLQGREIALSGSSKLSSSWDGTSPQGFSPEFPSPACHLQESGEEEGKGRPNEP